MNVQKILHISNVCPHSLCLLDVIIVCAQCLTKFFLHDYIWKGWTIVRRNSRKLFYRMLIFTFHGWTLGCPSLLKFHQSLHPTNMSLQSIKEFVFPIFRVFHHRLLFPPYAPIIHRIFKLYKWKICHIRFSIILFWNISSPDLINRLDCWWQWTLD